MEDQEEYERMILQKQVVTMRGRWNRLRIVSNGQLWY